MILCLNTTLVTVYLIVSSLIFLSDFCLNTTLVTVYPEFLKSVTGKNDCLNTTLVTVYQTTRSLGTELKTVSIQLLLLFIQKTHYSCKVLLLSQYNSCYCLSQSLSNHRPKQVRLNTTLVTVYRITKQIELRQYQSLNTTLVTVYLV